MNDLIQVDPHIRSDEEILNDMERRYSSNRGRVCGHSTCDATVRYSKESGFCSLHENSFEARVASIDPRSGLEVPGLSEVRRRHYRYMLTAARDFGVYHQTWHRWEQGLSKPRVPMVKRLAAFFGCSVDELIEEGG